jgi:hypothetical protein
MLLTKGQRSCNESKCNIYQSCEFTKFCCQDGKFKEILFFHFLGFSCSFMYKLLVGRHGDMRQCREWPRCVIQWCCGALRCWDLCTSSRLDVAAPGTWHLSRVCVCVRQVWPGFQQTVFFILCVCSGDLSFSSVFISTTFPV